MKAPAPYTASFECIDTLNDFLRRDQRSRRFHYAFSGTPSLKDAIEAIGIPHVEVQTILVNGEEKSMNEWLYDGDVVTVLPYTGLALEGAPAEFILDVHLGTLARYMRLLGWDTWYENFLTDAEITDRAAADNRIVLTRDVALLKHARIKRGYWLRAQDPKQQLLEVAHRYGKPAPELAFTRCLSCNEHVVPVPKKEVQAEVPPRVYDFQQQFYRCTGCGKLYWKGTHYKALERLVASVM